MARMITVHDSTKQLMDTFKLVPEESYNSLILRLLAEVTKDEQEDRREEEVAC